MDIEEQNSLVIGEGVSAHPPVENAGRVRVLFDGAEVEYPEVLAVPMLEELLRVFSAVTIEALNTARRVSHHDDLVGDVCKIYGK